MTPFQQLYNLTFSSQKKFVRALKNLLGLTPGNLNVYQLAFRHSSVAGEVIANNERLEFLGDAVLDAIVADYVFRKFPYKPEGFLTEMRSKIVSRTSLNTIARKVGMDEFIQYNKADKQINKTAILGNSFEALIGAIYIDKGYEKARNFVFEKVIRLHLDVEELETKETNFKSRLLEWAQKNSKSIEFKTMHEAYVNHRKFFIVAVFIDKQEVTKGEDFNKKNAEQKASQAALEKFSVEY